MRQTRIPCIVAVFISLCLFAVGERLDARQSVEAPAGMRSLEEPGGSGLSTVELPLADPNGCYASRPETEEALPATSSTGGIKEVIPDKFMERYQQWKTEFLSTEVGREQWDRYLHHPYLTLTINVDSDNQNGARTGKYKWDDSGKLVAANITVGAKIDDGYPSPVYYPVMNSLAPRESANVVSGAVLAATKLAHEFGHVNRMVDVDGALWQLQSKLMPAYNKILLSNGRNTSDPRLVELAKQMGGTPVEVWEDHEYWGEANAMLYLCDRITKENLRCSLFTRIRRSVELYAENYADRFVQIVQAKQSPGHCGWR